MHITTLIHKVLSGTATEQEKTNLQQWIAQSPENQEEFDNLKVLWNSLEHSEPLKGPRLHAIMKKIKAAVAAKKRQQQRKKIWLWSLLVAVTCMLLYLILKWLYASNQPV